MIGQTIMVGFSGQSEHDPGVKAVRDQLAKGRIGGVVLYPEHQLGGSSASSPPTSRTPIRSSCRLSPSIRKAGRVQRSTAAPAMRTTPRRRSSAPTRRPRRRKRAASTVGGPKELADAGINLNFGPVVDLSLNPCNAVIARRKRSYGSDAAIADSPAPSSPRIARQTSPPKPVFSGSRLELE